MGVLRMSLGQYTSAVSHLGVLARLVAGLSGAQSSQPWGSYAFPGPPSAMMVVGGMGPAVDGAQAAPQSLRSCKIPRVTAA